MGINRNNMTDEQRKDFEEAAKRYADEMIGEGSEGDMHWQAVNRDFLAGCEHAVAKWIDVKELLPEVSTTDEWRRESSFSDDVLVSEGGRRWFGYYTPKYGGSWIVPGRMGGIEVTHWQPLPELPSPPSSKGN
jgi:hypothetical protein